MRYPLTFLPVFKERVWGSQNLERLYGKPLPPGACIGESWEITDRAEGVSVIANGACAGRTLRWLMEEHAADLLGTARLQSGRFPLLLKILDARERLSLQVHPPDTVASRLGGEAKTEMWYVADAQPGAELFAGLKTGSSRLEFERRIQDGTVADCVHRIPIKCGDAMFLPSGRLHALGAGSVIFEIQQNSDTTYRVFDWNRLGPNGQPRELHIERSLACIDFTDFAPGLVAAEWEERGQVQVRRLVTAVPFTVDEIRSSCPATCPARDGTATILAVLRGSLRVRGGTEEITLRAGGFCLLPACLSKPVIQLQQHSAILRVVPE